MGSLIELAHALAPCRNLPHQGVHLKRGWYDQGTTPPTLAYSLIDPVIYMGLRTRLDGFFAEISAPSVGRTCPRVPIFARCVASLGRRACSTYGHGKGVKWESRKRAPVHRIELKLRDVEQLFNTMDPSPFHEKDLDRDAEHFIVSWAQEFAPAARLSLLIHLEKPSKCGDAESLAREAIHHYFAYRTKLVEIEFRRLMKQGRASLLVGLAFLLACFGATEILTLRESGPVEKFLYEGLTIAGWVAMWRPLEIYLYEWWPLLRRGRVFRKLSRMPVHVHISANSPEHCETPALKGFDSVHSRTGRRGEKIYENAEPNRA